MAGHIQLLAAIFVIAAVSVPSYATRYEDWNQLILTQHWPQSFCMSQWSEKHNCTIPSSVKSWSIHGLWTNHRTFCNNSWHFDVKEIEDLLPQLDQFWPDLEKTNGTDLWKHEWIRHGTCAATLEALNSQHNYFSKTMELYQKLDISKALSDAGVTPSNTVFYKEEQILEAFSTAFGVKAKLQCLTVPQEENTQLLGQIQMCWSREFSLVNCSRHAEAGIPMPNSYSKSFTPSNDIVCDPAKIIHYPVIGKF